MKPKVTKYIKANAVECLSCGRYLISLSRHDYRACECGSMVDGGNDYWRRGKGPKGVRELELYVKVKNDTI